MTEANGSGDGPTKKTKKPRQTIEGRKRRAEILNSAMELINEQSFSQISISDIANRIGIKREGVYYYYKNRYEILLAIVKPTAEDLISNLESILRRDIPAERKLELAIDNHLVRFERAHLETRITLQDNYFQENEELMRELRPIWAAYGDLWVQVVQEGQAAGAFRADVNAKVAAFGILGMCNWVSRWYHPEQAVNVKDLVDSYVKLALFGLAAEAERPETAPPPRPRSRSAQLTASRTPPK